MLRRALTTQTVSEETVLAHMRGWVHNTAVCTLCQTQRRELDYMRRAHKAERTLNQIIGG